MDMIRTKKELKEYIKLDRKNNFCRKHCLELKYLKTLRKTEYHFNSKHRIRYAIWHIRFHRISNKYLTYIPLNVFDFGLSISHLGCIYISNSVVGGKNIRISQNTTIGATNGNNASPKIGNNCFIGPNSCLIGDITIADDVCIAAGCIVTKSIFENGTTWGGVPARKISNNNSHSNIPVFSGKNK